MSSLRINIVANLAGTAWVAALTIALTPLQIHLLGIEAYGLVALISTLQIALAALDLGLSATITRDIAANVSQRRDRTILLVDTASTLYWLIALAIGGTVYIGAPGFSESWFRGTSLSRDEVTLAIQLIGAYVALRWPVALYSGILAGLQRMDLLNVIKAGTATLRLGIGLLILFIVPSLALFLAWFVLSAALELLAYAIACYRSLPGMSLRPRFSVAVIREVWRFSAAMNLIAILSVLLTQADRLVVSKLLGLEGLGYYSLAYNTAIGVTLIHTAINSASLPSLSASFGRDQGRELRLRQSKVSEVIAYLVVLPCLALVFYGYDILHVWVGLREAESAYAPLALLAIGFLLNALASSSYIVSVACGRPGLPVKVNVAGVLLYLPALFFATLYWGTVGAASCWVLLNLFYIFTLVPIVQRDLMGASFLSWLGRHLAFVIVGCACFGGAKFALKLVISESQTAQLSALVLASSAYAALGYFLLSAELRRALRELVARRITSRA